MMSLGPYASFIVTSYALVAAVVLILIVWIAIDHRRVRARLHALEEAGVGRRSGRGATDLS
jgi:heme exporter protein D